MRLYISKKRKIIIGITTVIVLLLAGGFAFGLFGKKDKQETPKQVYYSQLTGEEVSQEVAERPVLGIMVENSEEARPHTGLDAAGIVLEGVTEGGITRYLALYQADMPEIVGPARSLRTHFLDWAMGFDASIAHVGGSAEALELASSRKAKSLNQFKHSEPYYRDNSREAPHNMYVRTKDLRELQQELDHETSQFDEIPRKSDSPKQEDASANNSNQTNQTTEETEAPKVTIDFSSPLFLVEFRYDPASNSYTRYLAGSPHIDSTTNNPITVKNVIVIKTDPQATGVDAIGDGEALVFTDGKVRKARWQKPGYQDRIKIVDENDNEVPLNRGDSWIAAIASDRPVTY